MINFSNIRKFDSQKMFDVYDNWPKIADRAYENDYEFFDGGSISHIVFAGMGGSGALSDVFSSILSKTHMHVSVVKGYTLPRTVDKKTLVITSSVSGNTIETFSVLKMANRIGSKIIAFSSGGVIEKFCENNKIEHRHIDMYHSPRASFISFLYSMLKVLDRTIPIKHSDIKESIREIKKLKSNIGTMNLDSSNMSVQLADWIDATPVIYYPVGLQAAAIRFKNSLQENSKSHAIAEDVIEASHNGIVGWEKNRDFKPILIEGVNDHIKTNERWRILKKYFHSNGIEFKEIRSVNGNILTKLIWLIYLLDYSTLYLAIKYKIDPSPVVSIDFVKKNVKI